MEEKKQTIMLLDLMQRAAFLVENGYITHINPAAVHYCLQPGMPFLPLLASGEDAYNTFNEGTLHLTLQLGGAAVNATILRSGGMEIVMPEQTDTSLLLRTLSLAAMELRNPLSGIFSLSDQLLTPTVAQQLSEYSAQLNRRMMQLQRIVCNMADCESFAQPYPRSMETVDVCSMLQELLSKSAQALLHAGLHLEYTLPAEPIFTLAYPQKLERAVYNMLSNAAKFSVPGSVIHVQLRTRKNQLSISVTNQGDRIPDPGDIFTRYLRQPSLEDPRLGLGLGMVLIRSAATLHGGAVLIDQPESGGTRVSISMRIQQPREHTVCSPALRIDYAGERDHCLLELSDVLPAELYK